MIEVQFNHQNHGILNMLLKSFLKLLLIIELFCFQTS